MSRITMEPSKVPLSSGERVDDSKGSTETKCVVRQTMTALGPIISTVAAGMASGYSAVLLPQLKPSNSTSGNLTSVNMSDYLNMNQLTVSGTEEESWVAASAALAMAPGCWLAGLLMEKYGRRGAYLIISPVFVAGWLMVGLAPTMSWLIAGRFVSGLCSGFNGPLSPVFIAETSEPTIRGIFLAGISLAIATGIMLSHIFGTWLHWRVTALLCGLFPAVCFILCAIAPESPTWLMKRKKSAKAHKVWIRLRGIQCEHEFEALQQNETKTKDTIDDDKDPENISAKTSSPTGWKTTIVSRGFFVPFFILTVFFFVSQFSGANAVVFYSVDMFKDVAGGENAYVATLVLDTIRVVFSILACWMTRNYRRRSLTIASGIGTLISLLLLSVSLYVEIGKPWLPICFLFAYMCSISIGLVPLPWLLCGELFAASIRGLGSGLVSSLGFTFFFIVVKTAPGMMKDLGPSSTFGFYGLVTLAGTIFLYFYLPETKGKTLSEIEERFTNKDRNKNLRNYKPPAPEDMKS